MKFYSMLYKKWILSIDVIVVITENWLILDWNESKEMVLAQKHKYWLIFELYCAIKKKKSKNFCPNNLRQVIRFKITYLCSYHNSFWKLKEKKCWVRITRVLVMTMTESQLSIWCKSSMNHLNLCLYEHIMSKVY